MKLSSKSSTQTIIWAVIVTAFGLLAGAAVWLLTDREELINEPENLAKNTVKVVDKSKKSTKIKLPGTEPIEKMTGDYKADDHIWRLVNKSNPLTDLHYRPEITKPNVATRADKSLDEQSVRADITSEVEKLFAGAKQAGFDLKIGSGFRSHALQNTYYTNYSRTYGQAEADKFSAKPGYSEHQTGLAIDIATTDNYCYLEECFGDTPAGKWLAENSHKYGFILRYPKDKQTDFTYESWHFRYVGKDLAGALKQSNLTLDEATPYLLKAMAE